MDTHCRVNALVKIAAGNATWNAIQAAIEFAKGVVNGVVNPARIAARVGSGFARGIADASGRGDAAAKAVIAAPKAVIAAPLKGGISSVIKAPAFKKPSILTGLKTSGKVGLSSGAGISDLDRDSIIKALADEYTKGSIGHK